MESGHRVQGIRQVAITVADVDAALGFYRDVLGLALSASLNAPIEPTQFGIFRM